MIRLSNLSLIVKLSLVPAIILLLVLAHSIFVTLTLQGINTKAEHFSNVIEPSARLSSSLTTNVLTRVNLMERYLKQPAPSLLDGYRAQSQLAKQLFTDPSYDVLREHKTIEMVSNQLDDLFLNTLVSNDTELRQRIRSILQQTAPATLELSNNIRATLDPSIDQTLIQWTIQVSNHLQAAIINVNAFVNSQSQTSFDAYKMELYGAQNAVMDLKARLRRDEQIGWINEIDANLTTLASSAAMVVSLVEQQEYILHQQITPLTEQAISAVGNEQNHIWEDLGEASSQISQSLTNEIITLLIFSAVIVVVAGLFTWIISRLITRPIQAIVETMEDIAQGDGDLTKRLHYSGTDELGRLSAAFNRFVEMIQDICTGINGTTHDLSSSSKELQVTAEQGGTSLKRQQTEFETVMGATEVLSESFLSIAQQTSQLQSIAHTIANDANEGQHLLHGSTDMLNRLAEQMSSSALTMGELTESSDKIAEVLQVINGIAEQTNLLALNAAIEAARAGDYGRGFAVVADEVRQLAMRTRNSTEEIKVIMGKLQNDAQQAASMMTQSNEMTQNSLGQINKLGTSVTNTNEQVKHATTLIGQVAHTTDEQALQASGIAQSMQTLEQLLMQSRQQVNTTSESSASLNVLARQLETNVLRFKT